MRELSFTVDARDEGRQIKQAVFSRLCIGRRLFSRIKFQNGLLLDGLPVHADHPVRSGQTVTLLLPEDSPSGRLPQASSLKIAYEDDHLLVVAKPAPLPSQASARQGADTLENYVAAHLQARGDFVYRPVNRLDKGVSGLMAIAKNAYAQHRLQSLLHTPDFVREYMAVTEGIPSLAEGVINAPIAKADPLGVRRCVSPDGKPSVTHYRTLRASNGRSLLEIRLETGRTHQIRVHLMSIGCPVAGDFLYGREIPELPGRMALHAFRLSCPHPVTGERLSFIEPMPQEITDLLLT